MGIRELIFGSGDSYDYGSLCALTNPFSRSKPAPVRFYARGELNDIMIYYANRSFSKVALAR